MRVRWTTRGSNPGAGIDLSFRPNGFESILDLLTKLCIGFTDIFRLTFCAGRMKIKLRSKS